MADDIFFPSRPAHGYFVEYGGATDENDFAHKFCGEHQHGDAWCPNCRKPLLRILEMITTDPRLNLPHTPFRTLPLYFCWTCNVAQSYFFYKTLPDSRIEIVKYMEGGVDPDFPYSQYPPYFTGSSAVLIPLPAEDQQVLRMLNNGDGPGGMSMREGEDRYPHLARIRHQIGGEPFLIQGIKELPCPECGQEMPLFASIADDCLDPRGFTGSSEVQLLFHYCRDCFMTGAYHAYGPPED